MPGRVDGSEGSEKRKRVETVHKPSKRSRSNSSNEDVQARILLLETQIFESKKNYNNISTLIKLLQNGLDNLDVSLVSAIALCRIFSRLLASGDLKKSQDATEKDSVVYLWLCERYAEYKTILIQLLKRDRSESTALTLCMRMLKNEGTYLHNDQEYSFPIVFLEDILQSLLSAGCGDAVRHEFVEKYLEEYDDIRFYSFAAIEKSLGNNVTQDQGLLVDEAINFLAAVESVPEKKEDLEDFYIPAPKKKSHQLFALTAHKKHAQGAWLMLLRADMTRERRKKILGIMTESIAPWFIKPELLMDFLSDSYDTGGSISLLALSGLFYLIQERNLDYPSFYRKLFSLLDAQLLHSKHRSRFFRLLDTFLASTHLPAALVASFIKRLSRLTLNAPPAGIAAVVPWIYNLLKRHPTCTFMIHREIRDPAEKEVLDNVGMEDPFMADNPDPMTTNAVDSSLWEIVMLQSHYHPNVATLAKIISEQFTKQAYNLEDFLDHSYGSMLDAELSKEVKKAPVVEYEIPKKIFMKQDAGSGVENSLLVKLWKFS